MAYDRYQTVSRCYFSRWITGNNASVPSAAPVEVATACAADFVLLLMLLWVGLFAGATHSVSGKCSRRFEKRHILVDCEVSPEVIPP